MSSIPHDIIIIILSTLPVQAVSKFRCVSKSWCSLLSDPDFLMKHIYKCSRVIMQCKDPNYNVKSFPLHSILNEPCSSFEVVEHDHPRKELFGLVEIVGSCNGLVLININKNLIYLWNPTTGESKRLPYSGFQFRSESEFKYRFGYDKSSHDYKVVAIFTDSHTNRYAGKVKIYSLKTNSWKALEPCPYGEPYGGVIGDDGVALICLTHDCYMFGTKQLNRYKIVAYDSSTETYQTLPQPDLGKTRWPNLGVLGGSLCLMATRFIENPGPVLEMEKLDIWVMKNCGAGKSWTKAFTIPNSNGLSLTIRYSKRYSVIDDVFLLPYSDQVLIAIGGRLILYNTTDNTFRTAVENFAYSRASFVYLETLVSPNCFDRKLM